MPGPHGETCGTCDAWSPDPQNLGQGVCRADPPKVIGVNNRGGILSGFPTSNRENWCRSYRPDIRKEN